MKKTVIYLISSCLLFVATNQSLYSQTYTQSNSINFLSLNDGRNTADGITWHLPDPLAYGIYRTSGIWVAPNYQQLKLSWSTGVIIDGGTIYGKSGIVLQPNGGNVGIGTTTPEARLHVSGPIISGVKDYSYNAAVYQLTNQSNVDGISGVSPTGAFRWYTNPNNGYKTSFLYQLRSYDVINGESAGLFTITGSGNVGIGTSNPDAPLTVYGISNFYPRRTGSGDARSFSINYTLSNPSFINNDYPIVLGTGGGNQPLILDASRIGIGTISPTCKLDVHGTTAIGQYTNGTAIIDAFNSYAYFGCNTATNGIAIGASGNVGIGTTTPSTKLTVKGKILASEVQVVDVGTIPDYVFKAGYKLMTLSEVEKYVKAYNHLPDVPSEQEFKEKGMNMAEMNNTLLQKVEELTLYVIEKDKQLAVQDKINIEQQQLLLDMKKRLDAIEKK